MVYTLTLNPAIDYVVRSQEPLAAKQKVEDYGLMPGGKGVNAAKMLKNLGVGVVPVVLLGGNQGKTYANLLAKDFPDAVSIDTGVPTRVNLKLNFAGQQYDISVAGRPVDPQTINALLIKYLKKNLTAEDVVMVMGALPVQYMITDLAEVLNTIQDIGAAIVLDMKTEELLQLPQYDSELIKPNVDDLAVQFKTKLTTMPQILSAGQKLLDMGFRAVLISRGPLGAVYVSQDNRFVLPGIKVKVENTAGAGDAMMAGYVAGMVKNLSLTERLQWAMASGVATTTVAGIATAEDVNRQFLKVVVKPA